MKSATLLTAIAAASLGFASVARAQDHDRHGWAGRGGEQHEQHQDHQQYQGQQQYPQHQQYQQHQQYPQQGQQWQQHPQYPQHGGQWQQHAWQQGQQVQPNWQNHNWQQQGTWQNQNRQWAYGGQHRYARGGYLPYQYRDQRYWVDWRSRSLAQPPYGYQWVQTDEGDYVLMALATGLIASLLVNGGY